MEKRKRDGDGDSDGEKREMVEKVKEAGDWDGDREDGYRMKECVVVGLVMSWLLGSYRCELGDGREGGSFDMREKMDK